MALLQAPGLLALPGDSPPSGCDSGLLLREHDAATRLGQSSRRLGGRCRPLATRSSGAWAALQMRALLAPWQALSPDIHPRWPLPPGKRLSACRGPQHIREPSTHPRAVGRARPHDCQPRAHA